MNLKGWKSVPIPIQSENSKRKIIDDIYPFPLLAREIFLATIKGNGFYLALQFEIPIITNYLHPLLVIITFQTSVQKQNKVSISSAHSYNNLQIVKPSCNLE